MSETTVTIPNMRHANFAYTLDLYAAHVLNISAEIVIHYMNFF